MMLMNMMKILKIYPILVLLRTKMLLLAHLKYSSKLAIRMPSNSQRLMLKMRKGRLSTKKMFKLLIRPIGILSTNS